MNPRDLPEVVAELIIEMHEVRSEINALNGRVDRLERVVENGFRELREDMQGLREEQRGMREDMQGLREEQRGMRGDLQAMPDRIGAAVFNSLEPFLNRLLAHDDQLRAHDARLKNLESPH